MTLGISLAAQLLSLLATPEGTARLQPWVSLALPGSPPSAHGICRPFNFLTLRADLLQKLVNPNLALLLLLAGIFLIYAECNRPGNVLFGSWGTFAVMLGIYGLAQSSISTVALLILAAGLALLLLALTFPRAPFITTFYRDEWVPARKVGELALLPNSPSSLALTLAGTTALVIALATLTHPPIHTLVAFATGTLFPLVTLPLARIALRARRNKRIHFDPRTTPATLHRPPAGVD